jgi:AraC-like DNA-binding protein
MDDLSDALIDLKGLPPEMLPLTVSKIVSGTVISAQDKTNEEISLRLHIWHHNGLLVWHWESFFAIDATLLFKHRMALAGVVAALQNTFVYSVNNRRHSILTEGHYNLLFHSPLSYKVRFLRNRQYDAFGIHFPVNFLQGWKGNFGWLEGFLHKTSFQKVVLLRKNAFIMPPRMRAAIYDLQYCPDHGVILKMYKKTKSQELLLLAFSGIMDNVMRTRTVLSYGDVQKIHKAIDYMRLRPANKINLRILAKETGLNEAKLRAGFRKLYFTSQHAFHLDDRLQKACDLLIETDLEVGEIGALTGFKSLSNFTATFKRVVGVAPTGVRALGTRQ